MAPEDRDPFREAILELARRAERDNQLQQAQARADAAMREHLMAEPPFWTMMRTGAGRLRLDGPTKAPPVLVTGDIMITILPVAEDINPAEKAHIVSWLEGTAGGKKVAWPGFPLTLRINGRGRYVTGGSWECREDDTHLYVGNGNIVTPIWAPSCMMSIARYYRLDDDKGLVAKIHKMLAEIVSKEVIPVMTDLAEDFNGNPIVEIAVHKKEKILVGRFPEGDFRHLSGEIVEINETDWVRLTM